VEEFNLAEKGINNPIIPVQPSLPKNITDPSTVKFEYYEDIYTRDQFVSPKLVNIEILGVMRSVRIARITVAPVEYNPVTKVIKTYNNIEVEVTFRGSDIELSENIKASTYSPYFQPVYNKLLSRVDHDYPSHPDLVKYPVKYAILADRMFEATLQPFIDWKTQSGFDVIVTYTDIIGNRPVDVQNWIYGLYNAGTPSDPAPSFVLFVGDTPQIPASTTGSSSGKDTDLYYGSVDGDYFPEMYYGRMSATNVTQLQSQIDKILYYEKYEFTDPSYLDDVTLIAGADGTWNPRVGQATIEYGTQNYFNASYGFSNINTYLSSYTGCYDTVDDGLGFINYTAHCSETSWADPSLSQSTVNSFSNSGEYPIAIANCCLSGDFGYTECMGETWMRKSNGGAVGYIGSSPNSFWFEDFYWSVGAFPISGTNDGYVPTYEETTWGAYDAPFMSDYICQDALIFVGNLAVTEVDLQGYPQHSSPTYYWQAYNTLGDPSLLPYMTQGSLNTSSWDSLLPIGATEFQVTAEPGSYVAISMNNALHGAALVDASGVVDVPIDPFTSAGTADIVITKPQYQPVISTVTIAPLAGPYVNIESYSVFAGGDGVINGGESVNLTVTLKNIGNEQASNVVMSLSESDPYVTLTDSYHSFGNIGVDAEVTGSSAYVFQVATDIPDGYNFQLAGAITCTGDSWNQNMNFTASNPPEIAVSPSSFNETLNPGGNSQSTLRISNNGYTDLNYNLSITDPARDSGGPDSENYSWIDSNEPGGPTYNWVDISSIGTSVTLGDDSNDGPYALGFNVEYYGNTYNSLNICSNGFLSFTSALTSYSNGALPDSAEPNNLLAFFWDDLNPSSSGNVYYYQDTNRFIVEFNQVPRYGGSTGEITAQVIIYSNGNIIYQYQTVPTTTNSCTIGIENSDGSVGLNVVNDNAYVENGLAILFNQAPDWLEASDYSGTLAGQNYQDITLTFNAAELEEGVYNKNLIITSNDASNPSETIPVTLTVSTGGEPQIIVSPSSLDFGDITVNNSSTLQFTIQNPGTATLNGSISTPVGFFVSSVARGTSNKRFKKERFIENEKNTLPYTVNAGSSEIFNVAFEPTIEQFYSGDINITHNATGNDETIYVSGTGTPAPSPDITTSPGSFNKTLAPDVTDFETLSIGNAGSADLDYSIGITYNGRNTTIDKLIDNRPEFPSTRSNDCSSAYLYGNVDDTAVTGTVAVEYEEWWYSFTADQDYSSVIVSLCNSDYDTKLEIWNDCGDASYTYYNDDSCSLQSEITTGSMSSGTTWYAKVYAYNTNTGNYELGVTGIPDNGTGYCASTYSNSGSEADDWISNVSFASINNTTTQETNDSYGDYTSISTDIELGASYPLCVTLGFEGTFYTEHVRVWFDWNQDDDFNDSGESFYLGSAPNDGTYQICGDIFVPETATLGNTRMRIIEQYNADPDGSPCDPHTTTYGETEDYTVNITEGNSTENWLSLNGGDQVTGTIVNGGSNDIITVGFDTSGLTTGTYSASLNVSSNDPDESMINIPVTLNVSTGSIPQISVDISSYDFGNVYVGDSSSAGFTITNSGTATLISSITTPSGYSVSETPKDIATFKNTKKSYKDIVQRNVLNYTISLGSSKDFNLLFEPTAEQLYAGDIIITHNTSGSDEIISVSGNGVPAPAPEITVSPLSLSTNLNQNSTTAQNIQISNSGNTELTYSANISYNREQERGNRAYCTTSYTNTSDDWITNVQFNTINNSSGSVGYEDFTAISTDVIPETSYNLIIDINVAGSWTQHCWAWFDWNQDDDFEDAGEAFDLGDNGGVSGTYQFQQYITIPADADPGNTRVRVAERFSSDPEPCSQETYGEAEDYTINIQSNTTPEWLSLDGGESTSGSVSISDNSSIIVGYDSTDLELGSYNADVIITSNDSDEPTTTVNITLNVTDTTNEPDWQPVVYPNNSATLYGAVIIDGNPAATGDKVGAFVEGECRSVGYVQYDNSTAYITLVINVAQNGEILTFEVYDESEDIVATCNSTTTVDFGQIIGSQFNLFPIYSGIADEEVYQNTINTDEPIEFDFDGGSGVGGSCVNIDPPNDGNPDGGSIIITQMTTLPGGLDDPENALNLWFDVDGTSYTGGFPVTVTIDWDNPIPNSDQAPELLFSIDDGVTWHFVEEDPGITITEWDLVNSDGDNYSVTYITDHFSLWVMGNGESSPLQLATPANVTVNQNANDLTISWDQVDGALSYEVFSADDPQSTFTLTGSSLSNTYTVVNGALEAKKFFYIKAIK